MHFPFHTNKISFMAIKIAWRNLISRPGLRKFKFKWILFSKDDNFPDRLLFGLNGNFYLLFVASFYFWHNCLTACEQLIQLEHELYIWHCCLEKAVFLQGRSWYCFHYIYHYFYSGRHSSLTSTSKDVSCQRKYILQCKTLHQMSTLYLTREWIQQEISSHTVVTNMPH